jgi:hypothetical protein
MKSLRRTDKKGINNDRRKNATSEVPRRIYKIRKNNGRTASPKNNLARPEKLQKNVKTEKIRLAIPSKRHLIAPIIWLST